MGLVVLGAGLVFGGCASEPAAPAASPAQEAKPMEPHEKAAASATNEDAFLRAGRQFLVVRVSPGNLLSPQINVDRSGKPGDEALRGWMGSGAVNLTAKEREVSGLVGSSPLRLRVSREAGALRAEGLVAGQMTDLRLDEDRMDVQVGSCGFVLTRTARMGHEYEGMASCGAAAMPAQVRLPAELLRWRDADLSAALGLMLVGLGGGR
ncbi:hypothetical protein [Chondromyces crocatus]|nr:hypothetical protein [Chondromyces crocatus]